MRSLSVAQLQQHKQLGRHLQKANAAAAQALLTLRRFRPGQKCCELLYADLADVACRMNSLIGYCEEIVTSKFATQFSSIVVHIGTFCDHCDGTGRSAYRSSREGNIRTLEADPAWGVLVDYLLLHVTSTVHRAGGGDCSSPSEFAEAPRCLHDLTKALLRQQRHLAQIDSARTPEILVTFDRDEVCRRCGNPLGVPLGEDDDASR